MAVVCNKCMCNPCTCERLAAMHDSHSLSILDGPIKVTWIGGPPGKTFKKITERLRRLNFIVVAKLTSEEIRGKKSLPRKGQLVMINKDFVGHPACEKVKELCKQQNLPWIYSGLNTVSTTVPNLQLQEIIPSILSSEMISAILSTKAKNVQREIDKAVESLIMMPPAEPTYEEKAMKYETKVQELCLKFSTHLHEHGGSLHPLLKFVEPEVKKGSKRFMEMITEASKRPSIWDEEDLLACEEDSNNLNQYRTKRKCNYKAAFKRMMVLACLGYIERQEPYEGAQIKGKNEPRISFNFSLTEQGKRKVAEMEEQTKPTAPPVKKVESAKTALVPVTPKPEPKSTNLQDALRILIEVAHEEEPDMVSIHIDLTSGRVKTERKKTETFIL